MTPGTNVGTYEILAPIGGRHGRNAPRQEQSLRREVAIKMLEPPLAADAWRITKSNPLGRVVTIPLM